MNRLPLSLIAMLVFMQGCTAQPESSKFVVQAAYVGAALRDVNFDYSLSAKKNPPGFTANGKHVAGSACYAKISGENNDTITDYLNSLTDKQVHDLIADTRNRMHAAVAKQNLEIWQEVLCVAGKEDIPYRETSSGSSGKWEPVTIANDGIRKGAWQEAYTVVRHKHLYTITVNPPRQGSQP